MKNKVFIHTLFPSHVYNIIFFVVISRLVEHLVDTTGFQRSLFRWRISPYYSNTSAFDRYVTCRHLVYWLNSSEHSLFSIDPTPRRYSRTNMSLDVLFLNQTRDNLLSLYHLRKQVS